MLAARLGDMEQRPHDDGAGEHRDGVLGRVVRQAAQWTVIVSHVPPTTVSRPVGPTSA